MGTAVAIATAGGFSGNAPSLSARLLSLLSPGAAQLLIHPVDERFLFQDRAGTVPVTADGQVVGCILDVGPLGRHLTAVSDPARGVFRRSGRYRWIEFNGVNTAYSTAALPAPGVDKAQVFVGARKNTDLVAVIAELGPSTASNNGSFHMVSRDSASTYGWFSRGTIRVEAITPAVYPAPDTRVLTGISDISGDVATLRANGLVVATSFEDQGSGNFNASGTYAMNVGSRAGSSLFFPGNLYGALITRFSAANLSTDTITATEALLTAEITGAP